MQPIPLPGPIAALVRGLRWERDTVGRSFAGVYRLSDGKNTYYLKCGDEADGLAGECRNLRWLRGRLPVPEVLAWAAEGGMEYMLLSEAGGRMLCDASSLRRPELAVSALASGLRMLRAVDISGCPLKNGLDEKLEAAAENIRCGRLDPDDWAQMSDRYNSPWDLLCELRRTRPPEEPVFTHGDYCLPNVFAEGAEVTAMLDLGGAGVADVWQDVALCIRSMRYNFGTDAHTQPLLRQIGLAMDPFKCRYYQLLDELF